MMVSPPRSTKADDTATRKEAMERAARITAMLDRWAAEDVSGEPEWNVEDLEPMTLRTAVAPDRHKPGT
jgi:hypothetical protein